MLYSWRVHKAIFTWPGSGVKSVLVVLLEGIHSLLLKTAWWPTVGVEHLIKIELYHQNFLRVWRGGHNALLKCRLGPCTKTTNKKTFDSENGSSLGTPHLTGLEWPVSILDHSKFSCVSHYLGMEKQSDLMTKHVDNMQDFFIPPQLKIILILIRGLFCSWGGVLLRLPSIILWQWKSFIVSKCNRITALSRRFD